MTDYNYGIISTQPERRVMEDGRIGYFYSLQQLEALRDKKIRDTPEDVVHRVFNRVSAGALQVMAKNGGR